MPSCLKTGIATLARDARSGAIEVCAAAVARFYGEPLRWGLDLPLPKLFRWQSLMPRVRDADPMQSAVWIRKPPGE